MKRTSIFIFILFFIISAKAQQKQDNFKILCYNVLHGFESNPKVMDKYVTWVKTIDPDIVAFQEMNKFTDKSLKELAARYGHYYSAISKENGYPVAITSKYPIRDLIKVDDHMEHGYMYAKNKRYQSIRRTFIIMELFLKRKGDTAHSFTCSPNSGERKNRYHRRFQFSM